MSASILQRRGSAQSVALEYDAVQIKIKLQHQYTVWLVITWTKDNTNNYTSAEYSQNKTGIMLMRHPAGSLEKVKIMILTHKPRL